MPAEPAATAGMLVGCDPEAFPSRHWRVPVTVPAAKVAGAVVLVALGLLFAEDDLVQLVLVGLVALGLVGWAVRDLLAPVRLAVDPAGVTVVAGLRGPPSAALDRGRERSPWTPGPVRVDRRGAGDRRRGVAAPVRPVRPGRRPGRGGRGAARRPPRLSVRRPGLAGPGLIRGQPASSCAVRTRTRPSSASRITAPPASWTSGAPAPRGVREHQRHQPRRPPGRPGDPAIEMPGTVNVNTRLITRTGSTCGDVPAQPAHR